MMRSRNYALELGLENAFIQKLESQAHYLLILIRNSLLTQLHPSPVFRTLHRRTATIVIASPDKNKDNKKGLALFKEYPKRHLTTGACDAPLSRWVVRVAPCAYSIIGIKIDGSRHTAADAQRYLLICTGNLLLLSPLDSEDL